MFSSIKMTALAAVVAVSGLSAQAATVAWDEMVNGDLSNDDSAPTFVGTLAAGDSFNVIGAASNRVGGDFIDAFSFTAVSAFTIDLAAYVRGGSTGESMVMFSDGLTGSDMSVTSATDNLFSGIAGTYSLAFFEGNAKPKASYTFTINTDSISAVPLPAGLPLLLGGIGVLGVLRRKA